MNGTIDIFAKKHAFRPPTVFSDSTTDRRTLCWDIPNLSAISGTDQHARWGPKTMPHVCSVAKSTSAPRVPTFTGIRSNGVLETLFLFCFDCTGAHAPRASPVLLLLQSGDRASSAVGRSGVRPCPHLQSAYINSISEAFAPLERGNCPSRTV